MKLHNPKKGFTLIELMIAVSIIALFTLIVIVAVRNKINNANDARRKADLQRISIAFEEYYSDKDCYPAGTILNTCGGNGLKDWGLNSIPCDPVYKTPYCYVADADAPTCFQKYRLLNTLKYLKDPIIKLLGCDGNQYCGWETECGASGARSGFNYGVSSLNTNVLNPNIPTGSSTPLPTQNPIEKGIYACRPDMFPVPHANCNSYPEGAGKGCYTYSDPVLCQKRCDESSIYWCY